MIIMIDNNECVLDIEIFDYYVIYFDVCEF